MLTCSKALFTNERRPSEAAGTSHTDDIVNIREYSCPHRDIPQLNFNSWTFYLEPTGVNVCPNKQVYRTSWRPFITNSLHTHYNISVTKSLSAFRLSRQLNILKFKQCCEYYMNSKYPNMHKLAKKIVLIVVNDRCCVGAIIWLNTVMVHRYAF